MTRNHFVVAAAQCRALPAGERVTVALFLAEFFARYSARFDRERFLRACGVDVLPTSGLLMARRE